MAKKRENPPVRSQKAGFHIPSSDKLRHEMAAAMLGVYDQAFEKHGVTCDLVVRVIKAAMNAKSAQRITVAGLIQQEELAKGWRVVAHARNANDDVTHTVIETYDPDHGQRLKAAEKVTKDRGWTRPEEHKITGDGAIIHMHSYAPEPAAVPAAFKKTALPEPEDEDKPEEDYPEEEPLDPTTTFYIDDESTDGDS